MDRSKTQMECSKTKWVSYDCLKSRLNEIDCQLKANAEDFFFKSKRFQKGFQLNDFGIFFGSLNMDNFWKKKFQDLVSTIFMLNGFGYFVPVIDDKLSWIKLIQDEFSEDSDDSKATKRNQLPI